MQHSANYILYIPIVTSIVKAVIMAIKHVPFSTDCEKASKIASVQTIDLI